MNKIDNPEKRIIEAAKQIFLEKGFDGARMQEIADAANINKAMVHYYFRSKDQLFNSIFMDTLNNNIPPVDDFVDSNMNFEQIICKFVDVYISTMMKNPIGPMFILHELNRKSQNLKQIAENFINKKYQKIFILLEKEIKSGKYPDVDIKMFFANLVSLCVFPFVAKPLMQIALGLTEDEYIQFLEARKKEIPKIMINYLKNNSTGC